MPYSETGPGRNLVLEYYSYHDCGDERPQFRTWTSSSKLWLPYPEIVASYSETIVSYSKIIVSYSETIVLYSETTWS